jgi:hypothetical protein
MPKNKNLFSMNKDQKRIIYSLVDLIRQLLSKRGTFFSNLNLLKACLNYDDDTGDWTDSSNFRKSTTIVYTWSKQELSSPEGKPQDERDFENYWAVLKVTIM